MDTPLDELYFTWLYRQVGSIRLKDPKRTYWSLLRLFFRKEFTWFVPNDDNRLEDGRDLRHEFLLEEHIEDVDPAWLEMECSFLEMILALSRRLAFQDEGKSMWWFWHLVDNLDVGVADAYYVPQTERIVNEIIDRVIMRTYNYDGSGGLFPLHNPTKDQRDVELWYQLNAYLIERS